LDFANLGKPFPADTAAAAAAAAAVGRAAVDWDVLIPMTGLVAS